MQFNNPHDAGSTNNVNTDIDVSNIDGHTQTTLAQTSLQTQKPQSTDKNHTDQSETSHKRLSAIKPLRIGVVAGETSGDLLGADLMRQLENLHPRIEWYGVGGQQMQSKGLQSAFAMDRLAVMGLVEVLKHLPDLLKAKEELLTLFEQKQIDLFIGIDAPDFNLRLAKVLKSQHVHTVHYVSPSIWAWREKRIHKIMAATNQVLCLFPFELSVYKKYQHPAVCVGHPLLKTISQPKDMLTARRDLVWELLPLKESFLKRSVSEVIGLLPGSRSGEVSRIAPVLFATAKKMLEKNSSLGFLVPAVNHKQQKQLQQLLSKHDDDVQQAVNIIIDITVDNFSHQVMSACDVVILASGTVTLEAMLLQKPMVVAYKLNQITYQIARRLLKTPFVAIPNILAYKSIVPELIQEMATPERLAIEAQELLLEENAEKQIQALKQITHQLRHINIEPIASAVLSEYFMQKNQASSNDS